MTDLTDAIRERVLSAHDAATPLEIQGGNSKRFLGNPVIGAALSVAGHRGIIDYQPGELVISARAGTPLTEIEAALAGHGQMLAFEPPHLGANATLGGTIACGMSGPRRPYVGAVRDFILGTTVINGRGDVLRFGGEVMKNVAGYDVSRLMAGSFGTLGIIMAASLKVLPLPAVEATRMLEVDQTRALSLMNQLASRPLPLTAGYWAQGRLYLRFSGAGKAVDQAITDIGGEPLEDDDFWTRVREQQTGFFDNAPRLWRLSVPPATLPLDLPGETALDWGGAQRWLKSDAEPEQIRETVTAAGGHATLFRGEGTARFHPLDPALAAVHGRLKKSMDPAGILNPGRLYAEF